MPLHVPVLRWGQAYESLDRAAVRDPRSGATLAELSLANAGLIRRDLARAHEARAVLRAMPTASLLDICARAADLFCHADLHAGAGDARQSPRDYVQTLALTSGMPHALIERNMQKVASALGGMRQILRGLTRGLDEALLDRGMGEQAGSAMSFVPCADALGVVLPSNSPGVNSIWLPALAMKMPVVLKPGREEPWTPMRIVQALYAAGLPRQAIGFYPTDHEGSSTILASCARCILFGDERTVRQHASNPAVQVHGPGRSKVIMGDDEADRWADHLDLLEASIAQNGGRSCINASTILTPRHADALADALAQRLAAMAPAALDDPRAGLCAFVNPKMAQAIDAAIDERLAVPGARDVTAHYRRGPRLVAHDGLTYLLPTIVRCDSLEHPLANTEFLFPFASVVELPATAALEAIGPTLVASVVSRDANLLDAAALCPHIDRLNLGAVPTCTVTWDQPHEGNLFEFLYRRRAIQIHRQATA
jgi:acyl-CoA reductase-like NAD-dependent aldehyde dehydrogenase